MTLELESPPPDVRRAPSLHDRMLANFRLARESYVRHHRSRHWDLFPPDYEARLGDESLWPDFRRNGLTRGFGTSRGAPDTPDDTLDSRAAGKLVAAFDGLVGITGFEFVRDYHEARIGRPVALEHRGLLLDRNDLRLVHDTWEIVRHLGLPADAAPTFVEIGGGHGGLVAKLKRRWPRARCIILDLPEVNAVQTHYLSTAFPGARLLLYSEFLAGGAKALSGEFDFAILPGWTADQLRDESADLVMNTRSMQEMNRETIGFYFDRIHRFLRPGGLFYCVNRYTKSTVGEPIRIKDFPFDDRWHIQVSRPSFDQPWIHELIAVRSTMPVVPAPASTLAALPPYRLADVGTGLATAIRRLFAIIFGDHPNINPGIPGTLRNARVALERGLVAWVRGRPGLRAGLKKLLRR